MLSCNYHILMSNSGSQYHVFANPISVLGPSHLAVPKPAFALQPGEEVGIKWHVERSLRG